MDYSFQLLNKNNFTASLMLTIHKAWWVTHFCTLDWIFQIGKSDIHQVSLDMKDPNDSTLKLIMKVLVSYYISWIMNITRYLKPKLLVHGPHTKTTEMGYKKSTSAQRNNSPCIRQLGNTGASTRAIRGKLDTTKLNVSQMKSLWLWLYNCCMVADFSLRQVIFSTSIGQNNVLYKQ